MQRGSGRADAPLGDPVPVAQIEGHLLSILASPQFSKSDRMCRFLRFVVEHALSGSVDPLKEYSIGVAVFDKDPSFDPRIDNNVRTEARRLRAKLEEYYATIGQSDPVRIELPKGSYTPSFVAVQPRVEEAIAVETPPSGKWSALHSKWLLLAAVLLAVALGGLTWYRTEFVRASGRPRSIAVLPFLNLSTGEGSEFFTDGLTDEILNHLASVPGLKVVARTSTLQFKGHGEDIRAIGRRLNVDAVLEGSVRRSGNRLRITPQLIATADGYHLWSQTFERDDNDLFAIQDEISRLVVNALGMSSADTAVQQQTNPEAYRLCLLARHHFEKWNVRDIKRSIALSEQAIAIDPRYGRAYVGLAAGYGVLRGWGVLDAAEASQKSIAAAEKSIELDPSAGDGYHVLACGKAMWDYDWEGARKNFERARAAQSGSPAVHNDYALLYLAPQKRVDEAVKECRRALELDPLSLRVNSDLGFAQYLQRDYDAAIAQFRQTLDIDPAFGQASMHMFKCFLMKRMFPEARQIVAARAKSPFPAEYALHMGRVEALSGNLVEAKKLLHQLQEECTRRCAVESSQIAWLQIAVGDIDGAFQSLDKAYRERNSSLINLQVDPVFDPIRTDPRYHALLVKMHLAPGT